MRSIQIAGLKFDGGSGKATYTIEPDSVRGWLLDGVDMRTEHVDRPAAHGAFPLPGFLTGRSISWSGLITTKTPDEQDRAMRRLSGVLAGGGMGRLVVENTTPLWTDVSRGGEFDMNMLTYGRLASYRVQFHAPDPLVYGEVRDFPAAQPAINRGNFPATPRLMVGAGAGGYTVSGPWGRVVTVGTAPAAAHEIDFEAGGLFLNGVRQPGAITVYQPWEIPPGGAGVVASISGVRSLAQRVTETFI